MAVNLAAVPLDPEACKRYLREHQLLPLVDALIVHIVQAMPQEPFRFMLSWLKVYSEGGLAAVALWTAQREAAKEVIDLCQSTAPNVLDADPTAIPSEHTLVPAVLVVGPLLEVPLCPLDADAYVHSHNAKRRLHGVPDVRWSNQVAESAAAWARQGLYQHSDVAEYGENLYRSDSPPLPDDVVRSWYSEIELFDFDNPVPDDRTGHFTQVVWRDTQEVGCAVARLHSGRCMVVCQYSPPGNFIRSLKDNVPPPLASGLGAETVAAFAVREGTGSTSFAGPPTPPKEEPVQNEVGLVLLAVELQESPNVCRNVPQNTVPGTDNAF